MAQGSWRSGSVTHYGSTTEISAPGKGPMEPLVDRTMVPHTEAEAVYPQDPPAYTVEDPAGGARLHAPQQEGKRDNAHVFPQDFIILI